MKKKLFSLGLSLILAATLFAGCGGNTSGSQPDCPFSELKWGSSVSDMEKLEGSDHTTEDSYYGGTAYVYPREYKNASGTVKYSFDDKEQLAAIAWSYATGNEGELSTLYHSIHGDLTKAYGDSGYQANQGTNFGDVWYRREGNIIISAVLTDSLKALQLTYVSPDHSADETD